MICSEAKRMSTGSFKVKFINTLVTAFISIYLLGVESKEFLKLFPKPIHILSGGVESGLGVT